MNINIFRYQDINILDISRACLAACVLLSLKKLTNQVTDGEAFDIDMWFRCFSMHIICSEEYILE